LFNNLQAAAPVLACRSQAQAFDWSLVLISQGIESVIARREEDGAWTLEVAPGDRERAAASIAAYECENRTVWRREVKWTGLLFDARAALWFVALVLFHFFAEAAQKDFRLPGAVDRAAVLHGEWWRVFTAITLHADAAHLAANATIGFVFLGLAMGCYGAGAALLLSLLGGALGNVASLLLHGSPFYSLGASGFVMASLGLLTSHTAVFGRGEKRAVWLGRGVIAGCLLLVMFGFSPKSDIVAHVGGFIAGVVLGLGGVRWRALLGGRGFNHGCLAVFLALVILTWALALR
jgi:rhomboid protease GluP